MENNPTGESVPLIKQNQPTVVSQEQPAGAVFVPIHVKRQMKVYPIPEHELTMLQSLSSNKTFWSSVGSGAVAWLLACGWEWAQMPKGSDLSVSSKLFILMLVVVAIFSFCRACWKKYTIKKRLAQILSESSTQ